MLMVICHYHLFSARFINWIAANNNIAVNFQGNSNKRSPTTQRTAERHAAKWCYNGYYRNGSANKHRTTQPKQMPSEQARGVTRKTKCHAFYRASRRNKEKLNVIRNT